LSKTKVANEYLLLDGHKSLFSECGNFIAAILQQWDKNDVKVHYWVENVSSHIVKQPIIGFQRPIHDLSLIGRRKGTNATSIHSIIPSSLEMWSAE
jgi:hypothetical protein